MKLAQTKIGIQKGIDAAAVAVAADIGFEIRNLVGI